MQLLVRLTLAADLTGPALLWRSEGTAAQQRGLHTVRAKNENDGDVEVLYTKGVSPLLDFFFMCVFWTEPERMSVDILWTCWELH